VSKEVPRQGAVSTGQLIETALPFEAGDLSGVPPDLLVVNDFSDIPEATSGPACEGPQGPETTLRDVRAARSLLYNRLLLEVVQRRIERAETITLSYLLRQGDTSAQLGPYLVEVDEAQSIAITKTGDDGWRQLYLPELESGPSVRA
jgi:hypothetical protein